MRIKNNPNQHLETMILPKDLNKVKFGTIFTPRMFLQKFTKETGWHGAEIGHWNQLWPKLGPETSVFHYGQEIFEGLKAYRRPDRHINLFRHTDNMVRFNKSAERMAMPQISVADHTQAVETFVALEHANVPAQPNTSLYIRPTMIATEPALGVHESESYLHYIIASLAGSYFHSGFIPIKVLVEPKYRRAVIGGTGEAKTGGNYAASLIAASEAIKKGYSQVLWLDGQTGEYIEEVGAMNICFIYDSDTIVTPALSGSILNGITRDSILKLGKKLGLKVAERKISLRDMLADIKNGSITESFVCGTAAVIAPVKQFGYKNKEYTVNTGVAGKITKQLYATLTNIQYGIEEDVFGWTKKVEIKKH